MTIPLMQLDGMPDAREFGNPAVTRDAIFSSVLDAANRFEPIVGQRYTLALKDVGYEGPESYTRADEKEALLAGKTLGRRLRGTWQLLDTATNAPVDTRRATLATVPWMTPRGTFIFRGSDYGMSRQMRLRPGIFTREKESGELESHINVAKGRAHRYLLDPETGIFRLAIAQAKLPLISAMKMMGATDTQLREAWGNELFAANMRKDNPAVLKKLYAKFYRDKKPAGTQEEALREAFQQMTLDPEVTKRTLGKPYDKVDLDTMLAATAKLLRVYRGEDVPDDRDALMFQRTLGPEDIFAERIRKGSGDVRRMFWKAAVSGSLQRMQPSIFEKSMRGALLDTGLAGALEEINPAELYDQQHRITRMGEGGIPSQDAVPDEARSVQPSHLGFIDPVHSPESARIGVDGRVAINTRYGKDGTLYAQYIEPRTGKTVWRSPQQLAESTVAFPGELESGRANIRAISRGKHVMAPRDKVDYQLKHMTEAFGPLANLVPLKAAAFPQRVAMASRMATQALPLVDPEAPFVQAGIPGENRSFEDKYGEQMGAVRSQVAGTVIDITGSNIKVRGTDRKVHNIEIYEQLPYNRKTFLHNTPVVAVGDRVKPGQLLATSNFTDKQGTTALGKNARVAYIPYKGYNYEDAIVVSESFAKRATSEHMYQNNLEFDDATKVSKNAFIASFPAKYPKDLLQKYDSDGVIKVGETVHADDPLILAIRERRTGPKIGRRQRAYADASVTWDHHADGTVTDVYKGKNGVNVIVKAAQPMEVGDKMSGRMGDKGIVAKIVPDNRMPQDQQGRPFEVLLNPLGIISRGNPAQILESALGKIVEKTGQPYKLPDFDTEQSLSKWVMAELKKHGLTSTETIKDPDTGRNIENIQTGNRFLMKLHHTAEAKSQGRATGAYTSEGAPAKGGATGSKRVGMLELNALLSHGAYNTIRDSSLIRGQQNTDYWRQVMSGYSPPVPEVPFVYTKFVESLRAAGINPVKEGTKLNIMAMTEKDAKTLTGDRELKNADTVDWRVDRLSPIRGGLFDEAMTGGHGGKRWSYIKLHEKMPNPVMEDPIRYLLGLTKAKYEAILAGKEQYGNDPAADKTQNTGPQALFNALDRMNLDKEIEQARNQAQLGRKTARDMAIRRLRYLQGAKKLGQHPKEWFLSRVPVLPPIFRPISVMQQSGTPLVSDANYLYKELFDANKALKSMEEVVDDVTDERLALYKAFRAVTGLGNPITPKNRECNVKGILKQIFASSPKHGMVQRKLLGSTVDLVGRGAISPDPNLDMDHVGLPEKQAWTLYKPFLVRRLVRKGMPKLQALRAVEDRTDRTKRELLAEMASRPVIITRAPVLHKFGILAAWPQLTSSQVLEIPPLITGGFGADFDGDTMQFHVPSSDEAVEEAKTKLMPSQNLLSLSEFKPIHAPTNEYVGGIYAASAKRDYGKPTRTFRTQQDAINAYRRGEIGVGQHVEIVES